MRTISIILSICILNFILISCGGSKSESSSAPPPTSMVAEEVNPLTNKGIGPIESVVLGPLDQAMAEEGKVLFEQLCTACHKPLKKFIGPAPAGILERRSAEWVMNMIMNPEEMTQKDPIAKQLLIDHNGAPMANQNVSEEEARKILEYFRTL